MPRYIRRPVKRVRSDAECFGWDEPPLLSTIEVSESEPVDTGLLDSDGNEIWRMKDPIGFVHHD